MIKNLLVLTTLLFFAVDCQKPVNSVPQLKLATPVKIGFSANGLAAVDVTRLGPVAKLSDLQVSQVAVGCYPFWGPGASACGSSVTFKLPYDPSSTTPSAGLIADAYLVKICSLSNPTDCDQDATTRPSMFFGRDPYQQMAWVSACVYLDRAPTGSTASANFAGTDLFCAPSVQANQPGNHDASTDLNRTQLLPLVANLGQAQEALELNLHGFFKAVANLVQPCIAAANNAQSNQATSNNPVCSDPNAGGAIDWVNLGEQQFVDSAVDQLQQDADASSVNPQTNAQTNTSTSGSPLVDNPGVGLVDSVAGGGFALAGEGKGGGFFSRFRSSKTKTTVIAVGPSARQQAITKTMTHEPLSADEEKLLQAKPASPAQVKEYSKAAGLTQVGDKWLPTGSLTDEAPFNAERDVYYAMKKEIYGVLPEHSPERSLLPPSTDARWQTMAVQEGRELSSSGKWVAAAKTETKVPTAPKPRPVAVRPPRPPASPTVIERPVEVKAGWGLLDTTNLTDLINNGWDSATSMEAQVTSVNNQIQAVLYPPGPPPANP